MFSSPTPDLDSHAAEAIAHAERRRGKLERLSSIGMAIAEEIVARAGRTPLRPEPGYDPSLAFAAVARSVRLTLRREADTDDGILALRRGEFPAYRPWAPGPVWADWDFAAVRPAPVRAQAPVRAGEVETAETAEADEAGLETVEREYERLIEREDFDAPLGTGGLAGDLDACVDAIRAELGVGAEEASSTLPLVARTDTAEPDGVGKAAATPKPGNDPPTPAPIGSRPDPLPAGEGAAPPPAFDPEPPPRPPPGIVPADSA